MTKEQQYRSELLNQMTLAWMRLDFKTADRIADLIGLRRPSEHELDDLRREPVAITSVDCEENL
jgi:hypothetical protein